LAASLATVDGKTHIIDSGETGALGFSRKDSAASPVSFPEVHRFQKHFCTRHGLRYTPVMWRPGPSYLRTEKLAPNWLEMNKCVFAKPAFLKNSHLNPHN
jgi:hypothetical protein